MDQGKTIIKEVLHNSYWKYKQSHFKRQNPLKCLTQDVDAEVDYLLTQSKPVPSPSKKTITDTIAKPSVEFRSNSQMTFNVESENPSKVKLRTIEENAR